MIIKDTKYINWALWIGTLVGGILRFLPGVLAGFPVNDGGMVVAMIRDLYASSFLLPVTTSYNNLSLPFAYPPFGFYAAAFLSRQFDISEIELVRWLPAILSSASIPIFYWLACEILGLRSKAVLAALLYAVMPGVSDWFVMGGGLTRSFGILFSLFAIGCVYRLFRGEDRGSTMGFGTLFCSLTVLSHPEVGLQTAALCFLICVYLHKNRAGLRNAFFVALATAVLTAVWWGTLLAYHGFSPFQSAIQTGIHETLFASLFHSLFSTQGDLPVVPVFALIGMFAVLRRREALLVLWVFLPFFVDPRNAPAIAIFSLLMLVSEGLYFLNAEFLRAAAETWRGTKNTSRLLRRLPQGLFAILLIYLLLVSSSRPSRLAALSVDTADLETMQWVKENTRTSSRFVLITNRGNISPMADSFQEWFPVLAERHSVNTLQGREWVLGSDFFHFSQSLVALQACPDMSCITTWLQKNNVQADFILVQKQDASEALLVSLVANKNYQVIYDSANAEIFALSP